ncbi:DUF4402 domain-containing protein [Massilia aerilata]|uniref:DUF4402 domain-containing protein n=1 Tax=Massilia aerilata TaxID=453817 RepID=A0ABW0S794_9BURK
MSRRTHPILIVGIASLSALLLPAGREACAQQINLVNTRGIDFGRFVAGTGGTVVISAAGLRSRTGGVVLLNSPSAGQASFSVSKSNNGGGNKAVILSLPANGSTRLTSGSNSMAVNSFVNSTLGTVTTAGTPVSVGATLTVSANQPAGAYSGAFPLIVNFQ